MSESAAKARQSSPYHSITRTDMIAHIPMGVQHILDCGCGSGATIRRLKSMGYRRVCGVEVEPEQAELAREHADQIVCGDLNRITVMDPTYLKRTFIEPFDCILFGDILEHLAFPQLLLHCVRGLLEPNGRIVCSIPNSGWLGMVDRILNQSFRYDTNGHFDATHVRFFCGSDIRNLVESCGYEIEKLEPLRIEEGQPEWFEGADFGFNNWSIKDISKEHHAQLLCYQWLCVARIRA